MDSPWRDLQRRLDEAVGSMFDPLFYIDNVGSDTQAWVFWNTSTREACIAFRGTEQDKWKVILGGGR